MLILWSSLKNLPIASSEGKYGIINDIIVDPENSLILALEVKTGWFSKNKFLAFHDIVDFDPLGVVIRSPESLVNLDEIVRAEKVRRKKIKVLKAVCRTESGKTLGKVYDLAINKETSLVVKYYLRNLFLGERIIPMQRIIKINQKGIVFEDDVLTVPSGQGVIAHG